MPLPSWLVQDPSLRWLKPLDDESRDRPMCIAGDARPDDGPDDGAEFGPMASPLYSAFGTAVGDPESEDDLEA